MSKTITPKKGFRILSKGVIKKGDFVKPGTGPWEKACGLIGDSVADAKANGWTICRKGETPKQSALTQSKYVYVLSTGGAQWPYPANEKMRAENVFLALWPKLQKARGMGLIYAVSGGHFTEKYYGSTEAALKMLGITVESVK